MCNHFNALYRTMVGGNKGFQEGRKAFLKAVDGLFDWRHPPSFEDLEAAFSLVETPPTLTPHQRGMVEAEIRKDLRTR